MHFSFSFLCVLFSPCDSAFTFAVRGIGQFHLRQRRKLRLMIFFCKSTQSPPINTYYTDRFYQQTNHSSLSSICQGGWKDFVGLAKMSTKQIGIIVYFDMIILTNGLFTRFEGVSCVLDRQKKLCYNIKSTKGRSYSYE